MVEASLVIENETRFLAAIERAKLAVLDLTQPLKQIGFMLAKAERAIFKLQGPGAYTDLSKKYKSEKLAKWGFIYPILKASGRLESSLTDPSDSDAINEVSNRDTLYWGTKVPYAAKHQFGSGTAFRPVMMWGGDTRYDVSPDSQSTRLARAINILNNYVLRQMGADIGPTGEKE